MTRLYLRIFLAFWLVIILTIGAVLLINSQLEHAQRDDAEMSQRALRMVGSVSDQAQEALSRGGESGLRQWAERSGQRRGRLQVFVFDREGVELLERRAPRKVRQIVRQWRQQGELAQPRVRGQFITEVSSPVDGDYLIVLRPPPRPVVLRILGPLGTAGLIALAIVFSGLVCLWLARTITRPVRQLRIAGQQLGQGQLDARAPATAATRRDELGDLARDFNRMAERLQQLVGTQQQLLRDVSHELRSPLARLQVLLALATDADSDTGRAAHLARINTEIETLDRLIGEILGYARLSEGMAPEVESLDLIDLIEDVAASARLEGAPRKLAVEVTAPDSVMMEVDSELLHRAIENVTRNALRHTPENSLIELGVEVIDPNEVLISVSDQGPGVPDERLEEMFEPFVRLSTERSESGPGGGIGLAIARAAIEQHGGSIHARNCPGGGLQVRIRLPRHYPY
ncbi:MAG: ATP-binding protein [Wenzhouxiangellaceae bacterium]